MRPCHATAFALVGWYLMVPPVSHGELDNTAPLGVWRIAHAFDTAKGCEDYRFQIQERSHKDVPSGGQLATNDNQRFAEAAVFSQCVSADDRRLKGN